MGIVYGFSQPDAYQGCCLTIGNFDGVHRGHQQILSQLVLHARRHDVPAVVMTFDPHPVSILAPHRLPPSLTTLTRKAELISGFGVDTVLVVPTTRELLNLTAEEFFEQILLGELRIKCIVEGMNFCFGKGRQGTITRLQELCDSHDLECHIADPVVLGEVTVSSSAIRQALQIGDVEVAREMLGRPHRVTGIVAKGAQRGRTIGFPTANVEQVPTILPARGVYAARCIVAGMTHRAAVHLGPNPTFADDESKLEVHLLDFEGDLYDQTIDIDFIARLRDVAKFESAVALQDQLRIDLARVRESLEAP